MNWIRSHSGLFLLVLSALVFIPFVGRRDIATSHEARVVQVARLMAESGPPWNAMPIDVPHVEIRHTSAGERLEPAANGAAMRVNPWVVPIMNGQVRLQKPPLPYWCTAILYRLFGYSETASRIIPAIMGCLGVLLVRDLSLRLSNRMTAWLAAIIWISTLFVVDEYRKSMADPYLAFFTLVASWAWLRRRLTVFYVAIALGILSKGPLIFLFVVPFIAVHALVRFRPSTDHKADVWDRVWMHIGGTLIVLLIVLPWPVAVLRSVPNAPELWRYESIGAFADKSEDMAPWWYYLPNLLLITLPWTPAWLIGVWTGLKHRGRRILPIACTIIVVFVFSLAHGKKNAYLLPLMPLMCLTTAQGLVILGRHPRLRPGRQAVVRLTGTALVFAIIIQGFISGFEAWKDDNRSSRDAATFVSARLMESPHRAVIFDYVPEDATPYLPLPVRDWHLADEAYVILDDRKGEADKRAQEIAGTGGRILACEPVQLPDSKIARWKVYRVTLSPIQRPLPGAG